MLGLENVWSGKTSICQETVRKITVRDLFPDKFQGNSVAPYFRPSFMFAKRWKYSAMIKSMSNCSCWLQFFLQIMLIIGKSINNMYSFWLIILLETFSWPYLMIFNAIFIPFQAKRASISARKVQKWRFPANFHLYVRPSGF